MYSKDNFEIQATLATGFVEIFVGLEPTNVENTYSWKTSGGIGTITLQVEQTDPKFILGT